jgi:hypothetical protein
MHQGIGLDAFNAMPMRRAVHAIYECCYSVPLAADLARSLPYDDHDALSRQADALLFGLGEDSIDSILQAYPDIGKRPGSEVAGRAVRDLVRPTRGDGSAGRGVEALSGAFRLRLVMFVSATPPKMCSRR